MNILIAGASGFIGCQLIAALSDHCQITVLGRQEQQLRRLFGAAHPIVTWENLSSLAPQNYQAVINLCGHNIGASRWNEEIKQQIIQSRVETTRALVDWIIDLKSQTTHFYCANAIGIYGAHPPGDPQVFDEDTVIDYQHPSDYLSEVGIRWEQALDRAKQAQVPVTITRFGVVLKKDEGMLKKLYPAFYLGLGTVIGDGRQMISWVHYRDVVGALRFLLANPNLTGAFNITSPYPVSQRQFATTLASVLNRPLWLTMPAFMVKLLLGEMGETLLLNGQAVMPKRLLEAGYPFQFPELRGALESLT